MMRMITKLGIKLMSEESNSFNIMLTKEWGKLYSDFFRVFAGQDGEWLTCYLGQENYGDKTTTNTTITTNLNLKKETVKLM